MAAPGAQFTLEIEAGRPHPLGATPTATGVNFSLFSENATSVELLLFEEHDSPAPYRVVAFDPSIHKSFHFWHVHVRGLKAGAHYAYRVDGPRDPAAGHRFNRNKVLLDPYARGNTNTLWVRAEACGPQDNTATSMRSAVIDPGGYDWEGDQPLGRPMEDSILYEVHVGGFTKSPSSGVANPGTFLGLIEKIPYLKELGVTAVELMPVFDFDAAGVLRETNGQPLVNYWGYGPVGFFAPQPSYCVGAARGGHWNEFRDMVKALHRAGIEVILDVAFNHTDEGNHLGPVFSFKGIDNRVYYYLAPLDRQQYLDHSGCGNTFNCTHPIGQKLIVDSLRHWAREGHVDGFRFDKGSILARDEHGAPMERPPVVWQIELDEELADRKMIAEAKGGAGLHEPGRFPGSRWAEWNGRFRDDVRRFVRGEGGLAGAMATRIGGSSDLYREHGESPVNSVNFVACHDGFTLNDVVSYNEKHNEANGEGNRDGTDANWSWNYGVEGVTDDAAVDALRTRQVKNFAAALLLSRGAPMILAGDEVRRTQRGNNNAYCQDNELNWFDWTLVESRADLLRFWKRMIEFRKRHGVLRRNRFYGQAVNERGLLEIAWHGCKLGAPGWDDPECRVLAFTIAGFNGEADLHVMMNMSWEDLEFEVPPLAGRYWHLAIDTAQESPYDIAEPGEEVQYFGDRYLAGARSVAVMESKAAP